MRYHFWMEKDSVNLTTTGFDCGFLDIETSTAIVNTPIFKDGKRTLEEKVSKTTKVVILHHKLPEFINMMIDYLQYQLNEKNAALDALRQRVRKAIRENKLKLIK